MIDQLIQELYDEDGINLEISAGDKLDNTIKYVTDKLIAHIPEDSYTKINRNYIDIKIENNSRYYSNVKTNEEYRNQLFANVKSVEIHKFYPQVVKNLLVLNLINGYDEERRESSVVFQDHKKVFLFLINRFTEQVTGCKHINAYINSFYVFVQVQTSPYLRGINELFLKESKDNLLFYIDSLYYKEVNKGLINQLDRLGLNYSIEDIDYIYIGEGIQFYEKRNDEIYMKGFNPKKQEEVENMIKVRERDRKIDSLF